MQLFLFFDKVAVSFGGGITRLAILLRRKAVQRLTEQHGAAELKLIGSVVRGDADNASEVDLIVLFEPGRSLLDHGAMVMDLRELLGCSVDVVDADAMTPRFAHEALRDAVPPPR